MHIEAAVGMDNLISGKRFTYVLIFMMCLILGGCATDTMTKADLVRAFEVCGVKEEYGLSSTGTCERYIDSSSVQACDLAVLDPVTRAALRRSRRASRTYLNYGSILPIMTKNGEEAAVGIDHNTSVILYSHGYHDTLYLADSTWLVDDFIVGLKSRIIGWGKIIKVTEIDKVELYTEMTLKRPKDQSCLQIRN